MRWEKVEVNPTGGGVISGPGKRWGHTCEAIRGGRLLYVFGGYDGQHDSHTNQVHVFDTVKQTWSQPVIKGIPPTPRDSHTCTAVGDNLFVFGGTDGRNLLKDLHILDTSLHTWISPNIRREGPEAREGHSAACVGRRLFIFGGSGKSAENIDVYYNDLYILNTETFVWNCAATFGTPPCPRDSHTCSSWENKVIVIGGEDGRDYYLSDVHILDTDALIWRKLNTSGQLLPPRAGHSTVALGKNMFVFGGFTGAQNLCSDLYMLDVDSGIWTKVKTTGDGPSARFSAAGDSLDPCKGGVLVLIGGCDRRFEALDDMYYLYTELDSGSEQRPEKLSLRKQLKRKCQEQNLNPLQNRGILNIPVPLTPAKRTFEAKITESISAGFTIETVIDGKSFHGFLFANKPTPLHPASYTSSSKRTVDVIGSINKLKTSKVLKKDEIGDRRADGVHGEGSASHERCTEDVAASISSNRTTSDASEPHKVSANPEPEAFSLKREDDKENDTSKSLGESSTNGGENNFPFSKTEVTTDDQTNDVPNQGAMADATALRTEECSEPAKSI